MDRNKFFSILRRRDSGVFGTSLSQSQVNGIIGILDAFDDVGDGDPEILAYGLATAYHETGRRMTPVRETLANSDAQAIARLDNWARKKGRTSNIYWRPEPPYNKAYFGRGHVQLTWKRNYEESSADAGVDLVKNPDAMLDPKISARVLFKGLLDGRWNGRGYGLHHYLDGEDDLKGARRTVNITDKWQLIAGYYGAFLAAITAASGSYRPDPETGHNHYVVTADSLNVRQGPGSQFKIIGSLNKGDRVEVVGVVNGWANAERIGWLHMGYLSKSA